MKVTLLYNSPKSYRRKEGRIPLDESDVLDQVKAVKEALAELHITHSTLEVRESIQEWLGELLTYKPDVVFNLCEAISGESRFEMNVPSVLELARIPYTGSPPLTLGICQNKALAKDVLLSNGMPTPKYFIVDGKLQATEGSADFPLIVKPLREDGSLGIDAYSVVSDQSELSTLTRKIINTLHQPAIVEEYINGRELNVAIIGDEQPEPLPISEIIFSNLSEFKIVSYEAKWVKESEAYRATTPICPVDLDTDTTSMVLSTALKAYKILGCRDYARIDIRLREGTPYVLEVNPNPDISPNSGFPHSLSAAGISYSDFVWRTISSALKRGSRSR